MTRRTVLAACLATLFGFCRRGGVPSEDELRTQTDQIRSLIVTREDLAEQHVQLQNSGPGNYLTLTVEVLGEFADRASAVGRLDDLMRDIGTIVDYSFPHGQASIALITSTFQVGAKDVGFPGHLVTFAELHERYG